ncbi:MAG: periplasmic heavy metal sensor [Rhodospirillales bacterium]|jgi:uncharacterized membrane protein|nr:periplasmic heavy metal sensor [Rhodospirillales bacterium]
MITMTPRCWAGFFFSSLVLNLFLIGVIAAGAYKKHNSRQFRGGVLSVPWAVRVLGEEVRPAARKLFGERAPDMRARRHAMGQSYRAAGQLMGAPEFDRARFLAALDKVRAERLRAQSLSHQSMADFLQTLSSAQRARLAQVAAERMEHRARRGERRRRCRENAQ